MRALVLLVAVLTLAGCAAQSGSTGEPSSPPPADASELAVEIDRGDGSAPERYTLNCADPAASDHPAAQAACDHLAAMEDPFAPLPEDIMCTQEYGGPQTAHVTGRWRGEPVDLQLARNNGCLIAQWDSLGPLLPEAPG